jgi:hypothetical protein
MLEQVKYQKCIDSYYAWNKDLLLVHGNVVSFVVPRAVM